MTHRLSFGLAACALLAASTACVPDDRAALAAPAGDDAASYRLYLLAGQSNMEGYGDVAALDRTGRGPVPGAVIYYPTSIPDDADAAPSAAWRPLGPGYGAAYPPEGVTEGQFGPELSLSRTLAETGPVALVKYARGGTALMAGVSGYGSWDPGYGGGAGINQFDHARAALQAAVSAADVDGDGLRDRLVPSGIVWMQGEADAYDSAEAAAAYEDNLRRVVAGLRDAMGAGDLPVVIGRIVDSRPPNGAPVMAYAARVQAAQARVADADPCVTLVAALPTTAELDDGWHYGAGEQLALGHAFGRALEELAARCPAA